VRGFGEFRRRFGDPWSRSSLGPAVQQFFEHGGKNIYVVRVANNARGAMLCLPASGSALVLRALEPGSTESIRAAVDYDGIDTDDEERFNLTLQRINPATGLVTDQELFHQVSFSAHSSKSVLDMLLGSSLARVETPLPTHRPEATADSSAPTRINYVEHTQRGSDGHELSDYDLVGSRKHQSGLFALEQVAQFDILYLPAPGKHRDLGPTPILAAERYCRERGAMLIVDPPRDWKSPEDAVSGTRELGFASPNMTSYFPRMYHRYDGMPPQRAAGAALAGLLCKLDRKHGSWQDLNQQGLGFSRNLIPSVDVDAMQMQALFRAGLNVIAGGDAGSSRLHGSVTMGRGSELHRRFSSLPVRRLCLRAISAIDEATRWAIFEPEDARLGGRICAQVTAYLSTLSDLGALANDRIAVECDAGIRKRSENEERGVAIFVAFHPLGCEEAVSFTLRQTVAGCRVASTAFAPV